MAVRWALVAILQRYLAPQLFGRFHPIFEWGSKGIGLRFRGAVRIGLILLSRAGHFVVGVILSNDGERRFVSRR